MEINSFVKWLVANRGARITRLERLEKEWLCGRFAYEVEVTWNNRRFLGHAVDVDESLSLVKATAELLERIAVVHNCLPNSSGAAAHLSFQSAAAIAAIELVERDAFFCHWLTQTPAQEVSFSDLSDVRMAIAICAANSVEIRFAKLRSVGGGLNTVVCAAFGSHVVRPFGAILGLGCDKSLENAIQKSFYEVVQNVAIWLDGKSESPLKEADFSGSITPMSHFRLGLFQGSEAQCRFLFSIDENKEPDITEEIDFQFTELELPEAFSPSPFLIVRAECSQLQSAFFGPTIDEVINFERLTRFMRGQSPRINRQIHILG